MRYHISPIHPLVAYIYIYMIPYSLIPCKPTVSRCFEGGRGNRVQIDAKGASRPEEHGHKTECNPCCLLRFPQTLNPEP